MTVLRKEPVFVSDHPAGSIAETDTGYIFQYDPQYLEMPDALPVSLSLPLRSEPFTSSSLFPFFDGLIPEGWLLHTAQHCLKFNVLDRFSALGTVCRDVVGYVSVGEPVPANKFSSSAPSETDSIPPPRTQFCLHCGKPLKSEEQQVGWHLKCIRNFFGVSELPQVPLSEAAFQAVAENAVRAGITAAGVQKNCLCNFTLM